jgi:uncharacterized protein (DUF736 family)
MATIGTFSKTEDGSYTGSIKTLGFNVKSAQLRPIEQTDGKGPDYRVFAGDTEFGTAKKKTSRANNDYLSVKLDDPSFQRPIWAAMVEAEDGYRLIWSRSRGAAA